MKHATLFGLRVRHDYYADAVCRDLSIEPTAPTRRLLARHRLRLRELPDGIDVAAPLDADGKGLLIAVQRGEVFAFDLRARNPDFPLFTDPRDLPLKPVELAYDKPAPQPLEIRFRAKAARWAYYVVTDRKEEELSIVDPAGKPALVFSAANLAKNPDDDDSVATALSRQYPGLQRLRFLSDKTVPCSSAARKGFELRLGGRKVLDSIPVPSIRHLSSAKPKKSAQQAEPTLHHVVKYLKAD